MAGGGRAAREALLRGPAERVPARLIGPGAAVIFKGGGFYETDYRSKSYQDGEKAEKSKKDDKPDKPAKKPDKKKTDDS